MTTTSVSDLQKKDVTFNTFKILNKAQHQMWDMKTTQKKDVTFNTFETGPSEAQEHSRHRTCETCHWRRSWSDLIICQILQVQRGVKELKWTHEFNSKYSNDECLDDTFSCHSMGSYLLSVAVALPAVHVQDGREVFRIPEEEKCLRRANKRHHPPVKEILRRLAREILLTVLKWKSIGEFQLSIGEFQHLQSWQNQSVMYLKNLLHWGGCHQLTKPVQCAYHHLQSAQCQHDQQLKHSWSAVDHHNHHPWDKHHCWKATWSPAGTPGAISLQWTAPLQHPRWHTDLCIIINITATINTIIIIIIISIIIINLQASQSFLPFPPPSLTKASVSENSTFVFVMDHQSVHLSFSAYQESAAKSNHLEDRRWSPHPVPLETDSGETAESAESAGIHYWWLLQMARYPANLSFHHHFITITQITISSRQKNKSFIWSSLSSQFSTLESPS